MSEVSFLLFATMIGTALGLLRSIWGDVLVYIPVSVFAFSNSSRLGPSASNEVAYAGDLGVMERMVRDSVVAAGIARSV